MLIKIVALILPLGLDAFAVAAALGTGGVSPRQRTRTSLLFTASEVAMTLLGLAIGRELADAIGTAADCAAIALLFAVAIHMLVADDADREPGAPLAAGVGASVALGLSVSLDELAIGFTIGLLRLPLILVIALIGLQTFAVAQLGMRVGERIGRPLRESAERVAGVALALLAVGLLVAKLPA